MSVVIADRPRSPGTVSAAEPVHFSPSSIEMYLAHSTVEAQVGARGRPVSHCVRTRASWKDFMPRGLSTQLRDRAGLLKCEVAAEPADREPASHQLLSQHP